MALHLTRRGLGAAALSGLAASAVNSPFVRASAAESKLTFQADWLNDPEFLGYMIAIDNGYYKNEGLSVDYLSGGPSLIPEGVLLSGKADIALTNSLTTAKAIFEKGAPLVVIGTQYQKSPLGLISLASKNITSLKDLVGKTVACPTISESVLVAVLKLANIPLKDVRIVPYAFDPHAAYQWRCGRHCRLRDTVAIPGRAEVRQEGELLPVLGYRSASVHGPLGCHKRHVKGKAPGTREVPARQPAWLAGNFADPKKYPTLFDQSWFKGLGSTLEAELYFNSVQLGLMENPQRVFRDDRFRYQAKPRCPGRFVGQSHR